MTTYLFYDVETSGLNPAFDQILTFACIRTDLSLNEIDRQTITIKLRKDIVPSPRAFLTHGLTFEELAAGISEYQAAKIIYDLVNTPATISLGYNSLGFDDEFLRFLFYRNLLDPYAHQYSNGCSRMDILPITVVFKVFQPECLRWPQIDGKSSLKLELIANENEFVTSGRAHEAMNDVEALIALSKKFYAQKDIWKYCLNFFNKTRDEVRINSMESKFEMGGQFFSKVILASSSYGPSANYLSPALHIGVSRPYKNQSLWLRLDAEDIIGMEGNVALEDTFVTRKRSGDALIVLPALDRFNEKIPFSVRETTKKNIEKLRQNPKRFFEYIEYHQNYKYPYVPDMDLDASLYQDGFFSVQEKRESTVFHDALDNEKFQVMERIESPRIKMLAKRIVARNFIEGEGVPENIHDCLHMKALKSGDENTRIIGYRNDTKLSCQEAMADIEEVRSELKNPGPEQKEMISWLADYVKKL